jgi:hypothetical protein
MDENRIVGRVRGVAEADTRKLSGHHRSDIRTPHSGELRRNAQLAVELSMRLRKQGCCHRWFVEERNHAIMRMSAQRNHQKSSHDTRRKWAFSRNVDTGVSLVPSRQRQVYEPNRSRMVGLRWPRYHFPVHLIPGVPKRSGSQTVCGSFVGQDRRKRSLLTGKLSVGYMETAATEPTKQPVDHPERRDSLSVGVGRDVRNFDQTDSCTTDAGLVRHMRNHSSVDLWGRVSTSEVGIDGTH